MKITKPTAKHLLRFKAHLEKEELSRATVEKYLHDAELFHRWLGGKKITQRNVFAYKSYLFSLYCPKSINSTLSALRHFFAFLGLCDIKIKNVKIQKNLFPTAEKELSQKDYEKLLKTAQKKKNKRLLLVMQTLCSTGIRVSELRFITVQSIANGETEVYNKGKCRRIYLPASLCFLLKNYCYEQKRENGSIFVTHNGNPLDRSNIWADMKKLCREAKVNERKVFPHNLRHLFARTYYGLQKDIVRLADILGHTSVDTARIYTAESGEVHQNQIESLHLCPLNPFHTT